MKRACRPANLRAGSVTIDGRAPIPRACASPAQAMSRKCRSPIVRRDPAFCGSVGMRAATARLRVRVLAIGRGGGFCAAAFPIAASMMHLAVQLRAVETADLPVLFEHQLDPEATRMAAFPSREREAFMAHWARVLGNPACVARTILCEGHVAGNIGAWTDADTRERLVGYWIGREFWGRGVATAALSQFVNYETARPLTARVVKHNRASLRVLQKCGFVMEAEDRFTDPAGGLHEEFVLTYPSVRVP